MILKAIGDFHVKGHVKGCTPQYGLTFTEGIGIIDGEIMETLWSVLNESSRSTRGATLAHRAEILDDHMNHSNWKKLVGNGKQNQFWETIYYTDIQVSVYFDSEVEEGSTNS